MHPLNRRPEPQTPTTESAVWEITWLTDMDPTYGGTRDTFRVQADRISGDDFRLMVHNEGQLVMMIPLNRFISAIRPDAGVPYDTLE